MAEEGSIRQLDQCESIHPAYKERCLRPLDHPTSTLHLAIVALPFHTQVIEWAGLWEGAAFNVFWKHEKEDPVQALTDQLDRVAQLIYVEIQASRDDPSATGDTKQWHAENYIASSNNEWWRDLAYKVIVLARKDNTDSFMEMQISYKGQVFKVNVLLDAEELANLLNLEGCLRVTSGSLCHKLAEEFSKFLSPEAKG